MQHPENLDRITAHTGTVNHNIRKARYNQFTSSGNMA